MTKIIIVGLSFLAFLGTLGGGILYASNSAKPGDGWLYKVDRKVEQVKEQFLTNSETLTQERLSSFDEREEEISVLEKELSGTSAIENLETKLDEMTLAIEGTMERATNDFEDEKIDEQQFEQIRDRYMELVQRRIQLFTRLQAQVGEPAKTQMGELIQKIENKGEEMSKKMGNAETKVQEAKAKGQQNSEDKGNKN